MNITMIPDRLVQSLYLTLIHSLWQGILLAAIVGLVMTGTRKASARVRYNLLIGVLVLFTVSSGFTFISAWIRLGQEQILTALSGIAGNEQHTSRFIIHAEPESFVAGLTRFLNGNATNIVLLWLIIIFIRSLQLLLGLSNLRRLRYSALPGTDSYWQQYVKDLATKMGIYQTVRLAESQIAKVPMVIGHLKPLILIPAGLISALPPAELEAILIHELAHIRRRDYLVNLLQSLTEILFFFNPAVWWLSSLIRSEREHCCDDIAVNRTSSKRNYIQALVSCEEYQIPVQPYAMTFKDRKNLTSRVKRILSNKNSSLNTMEKSILAICLVAAGILTAAFTNKTQIETPGTAMAEMLGTATAVDSPDLFTVSDPRLIKVTNANQIFVPDPATPPPAPPEYAIAGPEVIAQPQPAEVAEPINIMNGSYARASEDEESYQKTEQEQEDLQRARAEAAKRHAEAGRKREVALARAEERRADAKRHRAAELKSRHDEALRKHDEALRKHEEAVRKHKEVLKRHEEARAQQLSPTNILLSDLVKDGIVGKNDKSLEFKLDSNEFVVNDKKQPESVFRKYKENYLKASGKCGDSWSVKYKRSID